MEDVWARRIRINLIRIEILVKKVYYDRNSLCWLHTTISRKGPPLTTRVGRPMRGAPSGTRCHQLSTFMLLLLPRGIDQPRVVETALLGE